MASVRGGVMRLSFIQTMIMEMGEPLAMQGADPAVQVLSRQFTGRIVTVSNFRIFSEPAFNYTRDFPFIWEERTISITYQTDCAGAERILAAAAHRRAIDPGRIAARKKDDVQARFETDPINFDPHAFFRITDNWLELSVRFIVDSLHVRGAKDAMSRDIIAALDQAGIGIASATNNIVGPPLIEVWQSATA